MLSEILAIRSCRRWWTRGGQRTRIRWKDGCVALGGEWDGRWTGASPQGQASVLWMGPFPGPESSANSERF